MNSSDQSNATLQQHIDEITKKRKPGTPASKRKSWSMDTLDGITDFLSDTKLLHCEKKNITEEMKQDPAINLSGEAAKASCQDATEQ